MRSNSSATIVFGLVAIQVKFYTAASAENIQFNMVTRAGNRVKRPLLDAVTNQEVAHDECDRGYEVAKNELIVFKAEELKALESECEAKEVVIQEFVDAASIDPVWIEKSHYLGPDKGADRGYLLLAATMDGMGQVAIAQWNTRGKEHLVVIRPYKGGLMLQQLFYTNEVRDFGEIEFAVKQPVSDAERSMAGKLVSSLATGEFEPSKYEDGYRARVLAAIEEKKTNGTFKPVTATQTAASGSVFDLGALLAKSLEAAVAKPKKFSKVTPIKPKK